MRALLVTLVAAASLVAAAAQDPIAVVEAIARVDAHAAEIDDVAEAIQSGDRDFISLQERLRSIRDETEAAAAPVTNELADQRRLLQELGEPPPEDAPPEPDEVAARRQSILDAIAPLETAVRQSNLNVTRIENLLDDISELRRAEFYGRIFERGRSPLQDTVWRTAAADAAAKARRAASGVATFVGDLRDDGSLWRKAGVGAAALLLALVLFIPVRNAITRRITRRIERYEPTPSRKAMAVAARTIARAAPGLLGGWIVSETLIWQGLVTDELRPVAHAAWLGVVGLIVADAFANAVFSPRLPAWRVIDISSGSARIVRTLSIAAVAVFAADETLSRLAEIMEAAVEATRLQSALVSGAIGAILIAASSSALWRAQRRDTDEQTGAGGSEAKGAKPDGAGTLGARLRLAGRIGGASMIAAPLFGYVSLSYYAATRTVLLAGVVALGWIVRALAREALFAAEGRLRPSQKQKREEDDTEQLLRFWIGAVMDVFVLLAFAPAAFLILGAERSDVVGVVRDAFEGFVIPGTGVRISFSKVVAAIVTFVVVYAITRFIQRTAETKLFPRTKLDIGLQNSLKTLIGYTGLVVAFMASVGALGFDFSNLAIIAGALSVGIGFGLQSIVNNFVSGLILLFERPIKVGDWIVTSAGEGTVKKISVRSTEIETFDRSSIIVPNSELISSSVTNWTHKTTLGRVVVDVGVSYDEDPEKILAILNEIGRDSPQALSYPAPFAYFQGFGDSSLNFDLRVYIRDINNTLSVKRDLRVAIFKRFREEGVEIPFPQRDLHLRSTDVWKQLGEQADREASKRTPSRSERHGRPDEDPQGLPDTDGDADRGESVRGER